MFKNIEEKIEALSQQNREMLKTLHKIEKDNIGQNNCINQNAKKIEQHDEFFKWGWRILGGIIIAVLSTLILQVIFTLAVT